MYAKSVALSALLVAASLSAVSAAPAERRCIGACGSSQSSGTQNQSTATTTDTSTVNTNNNATGNSNSNQTGNSGGGNSFGDAHVGKVCRRAYFEGQRRQYQDHIELVSRNSPPGWKGVGTINQNNATANKKTTTNMGSNNKNTHVNNTKTNNANFSNNSGQINGSGVVCRREFLELEIERRELDAGAAVLSALGGHYARSVDDTMALLATRDLGRMSDTLGVSARGHSIDEATHYKRDVGLQCATAQCDDLTRREAEDMLRVHARDLGFFVEA